MLIGFFVAIMADVFTFLNTPFDARVMCNG